MYLNVALNTLIEKSYISTINHSLTATSLLLHIYAYFLLGLQLWPVQLTLVLLNAHLDWFTYLRYSCS